MFHKHLIVRAAEKAGWLTFVRGDIVASYLSAAVAPALSDQPRLRRFFNSKWWSVANALSVASVVAMCVIFSVLPRTRTGSAVSAKITNTQPKNSDETAGHKNQQSSQGNASPDISKPPQESASIRDRKKPANAGTKTARGNPVRPSRGAFTPPSLHLAESLPELPVPPELDLNTTPPIMAFSITPQLPAYAATLAIEAMVNSNQDQIRNAIANLHKLSAETSIRFRFNKYTLDNQSKEELDKLVANVGNNKRYFISVEGFTDKTGAAMYNEELSQKRAAAVAAYLVLEHDIPVFRIRMVGLGKENPEPHSHQARAKDRRVEVRVWSVDSDSDEADALLHKN